jgi:tetratricopeptide (TPR) repeat protein
MDTPTSETSFAELLRDVLVRTDAMDLAEALAILEIARASDSNNIYLGALKRQLETMFNLQRAGDLNTEKKILLLESVPGIVECAVREHRRQGRPATERPDAGHPAASAQEAERELEALKLLYFQRASKHVMAGEYEKALAEVERVFVVDPSNSIAKQYAQRVEQLIQQARKLAAAPEPEQAIEEVAASADEAEPRGPSTAWTDEFLAPVVPIPEHRPAAMNSKQTIAFGTSLAESLEPAAPDAAPAPAPRRRSTRMLAVALIVLLMGGGTFAILTATGAETSGEEPAGNIRLASRTTLNDQAAGVMNAQQQADPAVHQEQAVTPALKNDAAAMVTTPAVSAPVVPAPARAAEEKKPAQRINEVPAENPAAQPTATVVEPIPAAVESTPAETPAFVAIEKQPEIITLEKPIFSPFVWKTVLEAQVVIRVLIDTDGNPVDTQILKSTAGVFEGPVIDAVLKSKFAAAQMGQGPVSAWLTIPFKMKQPR